MKSIYVILQVVLSLYCLDLIVQVESYYAGGVYVIGIHLAWYLLGSILDNDRIKKVLRIVDIGWLIGSILFGIGSVLLILILVVAETVVREKEKTYLCLVGLSLVGISVVNLAEVRAYWGIYILIGIVGYQIYVSDKRISYLMEMNQSLREQVIKLNSRVEQVGKANIQIEDLTRVNERNKLAQRLHDKIGHTLAGNIMQLEVVKLIIKSDEAKAVELISQITDNLREGMDDIRITLRELKPEQSEMGIQKIKQILSEFENKQGIKTYLVFEGDLESIDIRRWQVIVDNLREALTNMMKYSNGDEFRISIQNFNQIIRVSYEDNGAVNGSVQKGLGLIGMEERMIANRGRMTINTEHGFQINMIFNK